MTVLASCLRISLITLGSNLRYSTPVDAYDRSGRQYYNHTDHRNSVIALEGKHISYTVHNYIYTYKLHVLLTYIIYT